MMVNGDVQPVNVRSQLLKLSEMPVIGDIEHSVGYSVSYVNTMPSPAVVIDRMGLRQLVNPTKTKNHYHILDAYASYPGVTKRKKKDELKPPQESSKGALYVIKQYSIGLAGLYSMGEYLLFLNEHKETIQAWSDSGYLESKPELKALALFLTPEIQLLGEAIFEYLSAEGKGEEVDQRSQHPNVGNHLKMMEYERVVNSNGRDWNLKWAPSMGRKGTSKGYVKIPLVFRIDHDSLRSNDYSVYDERTDLLVSLLDVKDAPFHPFDVNKAPPLDCGTFHPGTRGEKELRKQIAEEMKNRNGYVHYRYIVDIDKYDGLPPVLYVQSINGKVNKLTPHPLNEDLYHREGVYVTYTYWDETDRETKYDAEVIKLDDEATLASFGVFDSLSAAKSMGNYKTKTTFDEAQITLESKLRKEEYRAKAEAEEAEAKRLETELKLQKEQQKGFWDGIKQTLVTSWPFIVSIAVAVAGTYLKMKMAPAAPIPT